MRKMIQTSVVVLMVFGFFLQSGCGSGWEQDPLSGYDKAVKDGKLPEEKRKQEEKDREKDARGKIFIDVPNTVDFKEMIPKEVVVDYRVGLEAFEIKDFYLEGLERRMPGAEWVSADRLLKWAPPTDFILGDDLHRTLQLVAVLVVDYDGMLLEVREDFFVNVYRDTLRPKIIAIEGMPEVIREGQTHKVTVVVEDLDSLAENPKGDKASELVFFSNSHAKKNAGALFKKDGEPVQEFGQRHIWKYNYKIVTGELDIRDDEDYSAGIIANSRLGISSEIKNVSFELQAKLKAPETTWNGYTRLPMHQLVTHEFGVFDPDLSATITGVKFSRGCDGDLRCSCTSRENSYFLCKITGRLESKTTLTVEYTVSVSRSGQEKSKGFKNFITPVNSN